MKIRHSDMAATQSMQNACHDERWGAGVETQKNVRGEIGGWGRVPFKETYAPSLSACIMSRECACVSIRHDSSISVT